MIGTLQIVEEILAYLRELPSSELMINDYSISCYDLKSICEEYLVYASESESNRRYMESQNNYIRLLEKENQELRG